MAVGAEVVLPAPVVGDDVPGPRVLGADDLQAVVALLGVAHPGLHGGPAAARHLVPGLLERPRHERRAPRVAGRDLRRREVLARPATPRFAPPVSVTPCCVSAWASAAAPSELPPPPAGATAAATSTTPAGAATARGRAPGQQVLGLRELLLVAVAVLLGGPLDVGDPLAVGVRVVDRLARRHPLLLDLLGGVQEPLDLQLRLLRVAGVLALVPDPDAHLEEPDRVGVAEVEVLHAGLDERGHQRQLRRQPALLGLPGHPGGDLLLRRVVARIGVGRGRGDRGQIGDGRARDGARRSAGFGGSTAFRNSCDSLALLLRRGLGGDRLQEQLRLLLRRRRGRERRDAAGTPATGSDGSGAPERRREPGGGRSAARLRRARGGDVRGRLPVRGDLLLEADVQVVLVRGVGEVAGPARSPTASRSRSGGSSGPATRARWRPRARSCCPGSTISPSIAAMSSPRP